MSEKKRKRHSESINGSAAKRPSLEESSDSIKVSLSDHERQWQPVIASTPGFTLPKDTAFRPYKNSEKVAATLLLHSEAHPTLDYTAEEDPSDNNSKDLTHYIAIYDPSRRSLKLIPAKSMTVRSSLKTSRRPPRPSSSDIANEHAQPARTMSSRSALGLAFGTKKSKKAIRERTTNAIAPSKPLASDPVASAVIEAMPSEPVASKEALQADVDAARPIPAPNLSASTPAEVYTIESLVGGNDVLAKIRVSHWVDAIKAGGNVKPRSHFVSRRIAPLCQRGDVKMVRVLRYLYMLLLFYKSLRTPKNGKAGKFVPKLDQSSEDIWVKELVRDYPKELILGLKGRFSQNGDLNRWHEDRLITHILASTLLIDAFETDTILIQQDLRLDAKEAGKYFQELGCEVRVMSKREYERLKITKAEANMRKMARLKVPFRLPKGRVGLAARR